MMSSDALPLVLLAYGKRLECSSPPKIKPPPKPSLTRCGEASML
jgi:hypothetical protein